jgi:hypothetical protein
VYLIFILPGQCGRLCNFGSKALTHSVGVLAMSKWLKPESSAVQLPMTPSEPLVPSNQDSSLEQARAHTFNLSLARFSLSVEMISYTFLALASTPQMFMAFTIFGQLGAGFSPAVESMALDAYAGRRRSDYASELVPVEVGKLYGGLGVLRTLL